MRERDLIGGPVEQRSGLGLERVSDRGSVVDDRPRLAERVVAEPAAVEIEHRGDLGQHRRGGRGLGRVDGDVGVDSVRLRAAHLEPADRRGRQIGGHRRVLAPDEGGAAPVAYAGFELPVGYRRKAVRHREPEVVDRLVRRVVVARKPGGRALWFAGHERAIIRGYPPVQRSVGVADRMRPAPIPDPGLEPLALPKGVPGADEQLLATAPLAGVGAVDAHGRDPQPPQVEVEATEALGRSGLDPGHRPESVARWRVAKGQPIVGDVVAPIAGTGKEGVADARRPVDEGALGRADPREKGDHSGRGQRCREP